MDTTDLDHQGWNERSNMPETMTRICFGGMAYLIVRNAAFPYPVETPMWLGGRRTIPYQGEGLPPEAA